MAESLVSKEELTEFLATIDMTRIENKKILAALQSLHPNLMNSLVYYFVNGSISFSYFYTLQLNNATAKMAIEQAQQDGTTTLDRTEFFRKKVKLLPGYLQFVKNGSLDSRNRLSRMTISGQSFLTTVVVDVLGTTTNSYISMRAVKDIYDGIVLNAGSLTHIANINAKAANLQSLGITNISAFTDDIFDTIAQYLFIETKDGEINNAIDVNTILGCIIRGMYNDFEYRNLLANMSNFLIKMGINYDADIDKTGFYTVQQLVNDPDYSWTSAFTGTSINNQKSFIDRLSLIVLLRKTLFSQCYGTAFSEPELVTIEVTTYNAIVEYFDSIKAYCAHIITTCKASYFTI